MVYVGTSGFSFKDWRGVVYPEYLQPSQFLKYYWAVLGFRIVELNFTYYTQPTWRSFVQMLRKTPPDFYFTLKFPGSVTHVLWKEGVDPRGEIEKFSEEIRPLLEEGRLKSSLAQFPFSFKFSARNMEYLKKIRDGYPHEIAVEFRHYSWDREEVYSFLSENRITFVIVDEPKLSGLFPYKLLVTSSRAYFRFHGRNPRWFEVEGEERYDYLYSREELNLLLKDVKDISQKVEETYVFFNNCYKGQAAINALQFKEMLEGKM
ncbi:DUF72 domain-containing protein [Thermotoga sp. KOL6]|uniref:DUF72 domain-containing protein n=1 Tax=Thermotoga sp. KOL6 TaxID=126741 RepID=UPI000C78FF08|nr:DUF72 domain-containing protein [Thermotoga sp. KOL6]PLV60283.1 hypothetical protein AS005_03040 [Thermotoga sp. KOL6]